MIIRDHAAVLTIELEALGDHKPPPRLSDKGRNVKSLNKRLKKL